MDTWVSVAARDGSIIADLPKLSVDGDALKQTLGRYETVSVSLPISADAAPPDWKRATKQGAAFLVFLEDNPDDATHGVPRWGGLVNRRHRTHGDQLAIDLVTAEGYLDRRYVGDETFTGEGQNAIVTYLVENYIVDGAGGKNGIPIRVVNLDGADGTARDRTYLDTDDKTIYSVLVDLMGVDGGPEWTIEWEWADETHLGLVFYVGTRIGSSPIAGLMPETTFDMPGCVLAFEIVEDFGSDAGANDVMAVSSGEGDQRPQSPRQTVPDPERPTFEFRFTPSTSITDIDTLTDHAVRAIDAMQGGSTSIALTGSFDKAPRLGQQWHMGDDVIYDIAGSVPSVGPAGVSGVARVGGWEVTTTGTKTVTPILIITGDIDG
jgi:hypothetical protein